MLDVSQEDGPCHMESVALRARLVLGRTLLTSILQSRFGGKDQSRRGQARDGS